MNIKLTFDTKKIGASKLSLLIKELTELGVYHNGNIICEPEMDALVTEIIDKTLDIRK